MTLSQFSDCQLLVLKTMFNVAEDGADLILAFLEAMYELWLDANPSQPPERRDWGKNSGEWLWEITRGYELGRVLTDFAASSEQRTIITIES